MNAQAIALPVEGKRSREDHPQLALVFEAPEADYTQDVIEVFGPWEHRPEGAR